MKIRFTFRARLGVSLLLAIGSFAASSDQVMAIAPLITPVMIAQTPANSTILYVNPSLGNDVGEGNSSNAAFRTITYALQQAQPGTVIQLAPGSYTKDTGEVFPLTIGPNIILRGDESNQGQTVLIIGSGTYLSPTFAGQNVTIRAVGNSEIRGVTVTNPNTRGTGIWVETGSPIVRNSTLSNSLREGIFVSGTGTPIIQDNLFTGNSGNGISVARNAAGEIRGNVLRATGFGIAIGGSSTPLVQDNQVTGNVDGIVVDSSARPVLRNNTIEANNRDGVVAITNAQPDLGTANTPGNNTIRNNGRHDLYNATDSNTLVAIGNQLDPQRVTGNVTFVASTGSGQFTDVQGHWAEAYISALSNRGIIGGFPDSTYRPNDSVTRAQFAAIVSKAFSPSPNRASVNFVDVSSGFWGRQAIQSAYRGGFLTGYPGRIFQPNQRIPRVQILVALSSGLGLNSDNATAIDRYQDAAEIPTWASREIAAATQRSIVVNYPNVNQLQPNREATRAEVAAFVYQALVSVGQAEAIASPYLVNP